MTNFEKYKKYILKWGDEFAIDKRDNEPKRCSGDICPHCVFYQDYSDVGCGSARILWLYEECHESTVDWSKIPVGTRVLVSDTGDHWYNYYFAGVVDDEGKPIGMLSGNINAEHSNTLNWREE